MHKKLRLISQIGRSFGAGEIFSGPGSINAMLALRASRIFIIHSKSFSKNEDNMERINRIFKNKVYKAFEAPSGEPVISELSELFKKLNQFKPDCIVSIGGGSVLDLSKLAWIFYEHPDIDERNLSKPFNIPGLRGKSSFVAIPTTAGTGSEMSSAAVFQFSKDSPKSFAVSHDLIPDIAILDPNLIMSVPRNVKIYSAMDALAHSIEGYVSLFANDYTRDLAELATLNIFRYLDEYIETDNIEAAERILRASNFAGIVQNISVPGLGHALSHQISKFDVAHGKGCGFFLPIAMKINCSKDRVKNSYDKLSKAVGFNSASDLVSKVENLISDYEIKIDVKIFNEIDNDQTFIQSIFADPTARANPIKINEDLINKAISMGREQ